MARNNYSFEKRQKELAKKKKRDEKRQQKADARREKAARAQYDSGVVTKTLSGDIDGHGPET